MFKWTKETWDIVIYCYICRNIQFVSYGVTKKSYGVTCRQSHHYDKVSHHIMFSALNITFRLLATHQHDNNMLAITKQHRFTCDYDLKSNNFSFFNENGVTPIDIWKSHIDQSSNKIVFHEKVKMIIHLRHLSCYCIASAEQPY